jgi:hypothetical protein
MSEGKHNHHVGRIHAPAGDKPSPGTAGRVKISLHGATLATKSRRRRPGHPCTTLCKALDIDDTPKDDDVDEEETEVIISARAQNVTVLCQPHTHRGKTLYTHCGKTLCKTVLHLLYSHQTGWPDPIVKHIISFLAVESVSPVDVKAVKASSSRGGVELDGVLHVARSGNWFSNHGTFKNGAGREWLEFSFGDVRRVSVVAVRIPTLPNGSVAVRRFHLERMCESGDAETNNWERASPDYETLNVTALQEFAVVPPQNLSNVRVVCTTNAQFGTLLAPFTDCAGLLQVAFA